MYLVNRERLQEQITNPDVLAAVIEQHDYAVSSALKVTPTDVPRIMKLGKVDAVAALAACTSDQNLLDKLCRDNRRTVREYILQNPNLTQDHIEEVAQRSLKRDKHYVTFATAANLLETDRLLPLVQSLITPKQAGQRYRYNLAVDVPGWTGLPRNVDGVEALQRDLVGRLPNGGLPYLQKLLDIGYEDFIREVPPLRSRFADAVQWYTPGMLVWMAPAVRPELVASLLYTLLQIGAPLTAADIEAAAAVFRSLPEIPRVDERFVLTQSPMETDTLRGLIALGHGWDRFAYKNAFAPNSIRMEAVQLASDQEPAVLSVPDWDSTEHFAWNPSPEAVASVAEEHPEFTWFSAELVNYIAERIAQSSVFGNGQQSGSRGVGSVRAEFAHLYLALRHVHPSERHKISIEALAISEYPGSKSYGTLRANSWGQAVKDWVAGKRPDKPTADKVGHVLAVLRRICSGSESAFFKKVLDARRISLILGRPQQEIHGGGGEHAEAVYLVFQEYFGDNVEAWQTGLQLHSDWDESLVELAETTCAIVGLDIPTEFVDLPDLEAASNQDDATDTDDEDSPESEDIVQAEPEQEPADEEDAPASEETVEPDTEEPDDTDVATTSDEENDPEEALAPLNITDVVQISLF